MGPKVDHEVDGDKLTHGQKNALSLIFEEGRQRDDRGIGVIWQPTQGEGKRPSSIYARGVLSLDTAGATMDAVARTQPRCKQPIQHYVVSLNVDETKFVTDQELISAVEDALDRSGWTGHQMVLTTHRDTDKLHVHAAVCSVHPTTLKAWERSDDYFRFHHALREIEIERGWKSENGLAVTRDRGLPTQRIERAGVPTQIAWRRDRESERLENLGHSFLNEADGLESVKDRYDHLVRDIREYMSSGETPLRADIHILAAKRTFRIEECSGGGLQLRLQHRAPKGTVARVGVDEFGDAVEREAKSLPTDIVMDLNLKDILPSQYDGDVKKLSDKARERHEAVLATRKWLADLGSVERSEKEFLAAIKADPDRGIRTIHAEGNAIMDAGDIDGYHADRITDGWLELSEWVQRESKELVVLSPDASLPLYTLKSHQALHDEVIAMAQKLVVMKDPTFNRAALDKAILDEEKALGCKFSPEQHKVFDTMDRMFSFVQGDAGCGKSTMMSVERRYCEIIGMEIAGLATSQLAAEGLGEKAKIKSVNTARALAMERARGIEAIKPNSRVIIDEATMTSLDALHDVFSRALAQGARVRPIGDLAQLPNIAAGDTGRSLVAVAKAGGAYAEMTTVFRQRERTEKEEKQLGRYSPSVAWMAAEVPKGAKAIRDGNSAGYRAFLNKIVEHGHVEFHANRSEEVKAKARDLLAAAKDGIRVLAPGYSKKECLFVNKAVRAGLGHEGKGETFRVYNGLREFAKGDCVEFGLNDQKKNDGTWYDAKRLDVLNGYTGVVTAVTKEKIEVRLDKDDRTVIVDPKKYNRLDYSWAVTTHKAQGRGDPLVFPTIGKGDNARTAFVAFTRCQVGLKIHTTLPADQFVEHLSSYDSIRPKEDIAFYNEMVLETGGPDSYLAKSVKTALADENDPLRQQHRKEIEKMTKARDREILHTMETFEAARKSAPTAVERKKLVGEENREIDEAIARYPLPAFAQWAYERRTIITNSEGRSEARQAFVRAAQRAEAVQAMAQKAKEASVKPSVKQKAPEQAPAVKRGRGR